MVAIEIVAGALRTAAASLVGSKAFGKGLVQTVIPWAWFSFEATTARYAAAAISSMKPG